MTNSTGFTILYSMDEIWIEIHQPSNNYDPRAIIALSNRGNMKRRNGSIEPIPLRQTIYGQPHKVIAYRILMEYFKPRTAEDIALGRNQVDHITHNPSDMNVNDIRNMRWCTIKENSNFEEAKHNKSIKLKGRKLSVESRKKLSESCKGRIPWNKGKKGYSLHTEESRRKISEGVKKHHAKSD